LRRLSERRRDRWTERAFVLDGPHLVTDALDHDHPLEAVFVDASCDVDLTTCTAAVHVVEPGVLAKATDTVSPQGIAAIAPMPENDEGIVDRIADRSGIVLVLAGVGDPGNAGTLLRISEAAGVGAVLFCDEAVDPFAPKCVRASAGSILHVPVMSGVRSVHVLEAIGARGVRRLGTAASRGQPYDRADLHGPLALVLGSEAQGIPPETEALVDEWTHVPMAGHVESLNVAVTGALLCFEAARS
jgi:TrmH family RNA methyltransferase